MFNDIVWRPEPQFGQQFIITSSVVLQALFTSMIIGYLKSKPPATKTVMDLVNIVLLSWLMAGGISKAINVGVITLCSDSGHVQVLMEGVPRTRHSTTLFGAFYAVTVTFVPPVSHQREL